ncbi:MULTISPECIES: universal stress protein [unclassified Mucilaginibacter]|uniref:universal stress protein n=1 Tax=unclassified Mucilaginibacter TaxID=2617802 RepID=UPI0031F6FAB3
METTRILIGIDESKYADYAAEYGFNLARKLDAAVGIVNIIEPVPAVVSPMNDTTFGLPFEGTAEINTVEMMNTQNQAADSLLGRIVQKYGTDLQVTQYTDYGSSADGIVNCGAQFGATLIVIGTHHRSGFDRLLMGSVAEEVVRKSKVPVLVVPLNEAETV